MYRDVRFSPKAWVQWAHNHRDHHSRAAVTTKSEGKENRIKYHFQKPEGGWVQWVTRSIPSPAPGFKVFPHHTPWYKPWLWRFRTEVRGRDRIEHRGWKHTVYIFTSAPIGVVETYRSVDGRRVQVSAHLCQ